MLKKAPMKFDKELFKGTVLNNIKTLYRRTLEENSLSVSGMSARKQQFLVTALDRGFLRQGFRISIIFPVVNSPQITIPFFRKKKEML